MPVFGWILKGLHALPVYRKQDNPGQTAKNEGTLDAARAALHARAAPSPSSPRARVTRSPCSPS